MGVFLSISNAFLQFSVKSSIEPKPRYILPFKARISAVSLIEMALLIK